jgi:hypothetical protein
VGLRVACLISGLSRYKEVARAMAEGISKCGDRATFIWNNDIAYADVAVMYGWKHRDRLFRFPQFVYADLGYWNRTDYYRLCVNSWGPEKYVKAGLPSGRFESLGVTIKPWRTEGKEIIVMGASEKAMPQHGYGYMKWEVKTLRACEKFGKRVVFRPKPKDQSKHPVNGYGYDERPLDVALQNAWAVVAHHSNAALDALVAGVPVHCEKGAAAAFSVPFESLADPVLLPGREQFLADVAWLQWTAAEMRSGEAWAHLKERRLIK